MTAAAEPNRLPSRRALWRAEFTALLALAAPMALTQLVQFSIQTIDVLMIGRLGPEPLAASSIGLVVFFATFLFGFGPAMAISPLVSQALGRDPGATDDVRRSVRMGLWAIVLIYPLPALLYVFAEPLALALGQPPELARLAGPYVLALAPGLPFALGVIILRNFLAALGRANVPLAIIIATTALNAFLNWLLIYGHWGFPRWELVGAGIASSLSHAAGFFALVAYIGIDRAAARFRLFEGVLRPDFARLREVARLGWPIGVTMAFEATLFNAAVFLMGRIGVNEVAAYQVALNVAALAFMAPLGVSMAGAARVGLAAGAADRAGVARAATLTIALSAAAIAPFAVVMLAAPHGIAGLYLDAADAKNARVIALVAAFLPIAAAFALFDATQVAANQCLRGLKDVRWPMILTGVSYWIVGFPVSAGFGLGTSAGAIGVWWGLLIALIVASATLVGRLFLLLRRESGAVTPPAPARAS